VHPWVGVAGAGWRVNSRSSNAEVREWKRQCRGVTIVCEVEPTGCVALLPLGVRAFWARIIFRWAKWQTFTGSKIRRGSVKWSLSSDEVDGIDFMGSLRLGWVSFTSEFTALELRIVTQTHSERWYPKGRSYSKTQRSPGPPWWDDLQELSQIKYIVDYSIHAFCTCRLNQLLTEEISSVLNTCRPYFLITILYTIQYTSYTVFTLQLGIASHVEMT
jgi:hypothetical protein